MCTNEGVGVKEGIFGHEQGLFGSGRGWHTVLGCVKMGLKQANCGTATELEVVISR